MERGCTACMVVVCWWMAGAGAPLGSLSWWKLPWLGPQLDMFCKGLAR